MPVKKDDFSAFDNAVKQAQASKQPTSKEIDFSAFDNAVKKKGGQTSLKESQAGVSKSTTPTTPKQTWETSALNPKATAEKYVQPAFEDLSTVEKKAAVKKGLYVAEKPQKIVSEVVKERENPAIDYTRSVETIENDFRKNGINNPSFINNAINGTGQLTPDGSLPISKYSNDRLNKIDDKIREINQNLKPIPYAVMGDVYNKQLDEWKKQLVQLSQEKQELQKSATVVAANQAVNTVPKPTSDSPEEKSKYYQKIGRLVAQATEPIKVEKENINESTGNNLNRNKEIVAQENLERERQGLAAVKNKLDVDYNLGRISDEDYQAQKNEIVNRHANLLNNYPDAKRKVYAQAVGQLIEEKRDKENTALSTTNISGINLGGAKSLLQNVLYWGATSDEVKDAFAELKKRGADIDPDVEKYLISHPGETSGTSTIGNAYNLVIAKTRQSLEDLLGRDENVSESERYKKEQYFTPLPSQEFKQPDYIVSTNGDDILSEKENPKAGETNAYGVVNAMGNTVATVLKYALLTKGFGAAAEAGLGSTIGADSGFVETAGAVKKLSDVQRNFIGTWGATILESHHDNLEAAKQFTNDVNQQKVYASLMDIVNTLVFTKVNPEGIVNKITGVDKEAAKNFFSLTAKEGIKVVDKQTAFNFFKNTIEGTAKNLGHTLPLLEVNRLAGVAVQAAFNPQSVKDLKVGEGLAQDAISFLPVALFTGFAEAKNTALMNESIRKSVYNYAQDPQMFENYVNQQVEQGKMKKEDADAKISFVNKLANTIQSNDFKTDKVKNLSEEDKIKYATNLAQEKTLLDEIDGITDEVQLAEKKEQVKNLRAERIEMLKPKPVEVKVEVPKGKELPDTQIVPTFEQIKLQVPEEDLQSTQDVIAKMNNAEEINEGDISKAENGLLKALDAHPESAHLIEPLLNKLYTYEFTTKTETRTITEKEPVGGVGKARQQKIPANTSLEQWEGNRATVTDADGKETTGILRKDENGSYSLYNENGDKVASIGEAAITNRDISLPSPEDVPMPIEMGEDGMPKSITLQLNRVNMEAGGVEPTKTIKIEFKDKEKALDLAIQLRAEQVGEVPDAAFEQAYNEVQREIKTEVPKYTEEEIAKKKEAIYGKEEKPKIYEYNGKKYEITESNITDLETGDLKPIEFKDEVLSKGKEVTSEEKVETEKKKTKAQQVGEGLLGHLGLPTGEPTSQAPKVYTIDNINEVDKSGYTGDKKFVIDGIANVVKAINKLVKKSIGKELTVHVHDTVDSFRKEVYNAMIRDKASKEKALAESKEAGNKGFYAASDGSIHLNMTKATKDTLLHEGFHPILDYMANNNPDVINDLHNQLVKITGKDITEAEFPEQKTGKEFIKLAQRRYRGDITQKKEAITDFIAQVASGRFKIDQSNYEKVRDFFVNMLRKIGLLKSFDAKAYERLMNKEITSVKDLKQLAKLITEKFATGEEVKTEVKGINEPDVKNGDVVATGVVPKDLKEDKNAKPTQLSKDEETELKRDGILKYLKFGNLSDISGEYMTTTMSDRAVAGDLSYKEGKAYLKKGGALYPLLMKKLGLNRVWASMEKSKLNTLINNLKTDKDGYAYIGIMSMGKQSHMSNIDAFNFVFDAIDAELKDRKSTLTKQMFLDAVNQAYEKKYATGKSIADAVGKPKLNKNMSIAEIKNAVLENISHSDAAFDIRRNFLESLLGNAEKKEGRLGQVSNYKKMAALLEEPLVRDSKNGDVVAYMKVKKSDLSVIKTNPDENGHHNSYPYSIESKSPIDYVFLNSPVHVSDIYPEFINKSGNKVSYEEAKAKYGEEKAMRTHTRNVVLSAPSEKIPQFSREEEESNQKPISSQYETVQPETKRTTGEVKINSEKVQYNGKDAIGSRTRTESEQIASRNAAKEKIKNPETNASLKSANSYNESVGLPEVTSHKYKPSDPILQTRIAKTYPNLQDVNSPTYKETNIERRIYSEYKDKYPEIFKQYDIKDYKDLVHKAYGQLIKETQLQYDALPVKVSFHENGEGNYENNFEMLDDVHNFNHLWVYKGGDDHTELGSKTRDKDGLTANDKFRAVHDYYGHSVEGYQFGKDGEENAWIEHSKMFSPLAQWALSSETRGQNSWVNYSGVNDAVLETIKTASALKKEGKKIGNQEMVDEADKLLSKVYDEFTFAEQKAIVLPPEFTDISKYHGTKISEVPEQLQPKTKKVLGIQGEGERNPKASDILAKYEKGTIINSKEISDKGKSTDNIVNKVFKLFEDKFKSIKISGKRPTEGAAFYNKGEKQIDINKNSTHWNDVEPDNFINILAHEYAHHLIEESPNVKDIESKLDDIKKDLVENPPKNMTEAESSVYKFMTSKGNSPQEIITYAVSHPEIRKFLTPYAEDINKISNQIIGEDIITGEAEPTQFSKEEEELPQFSKSKEQESQIKKYIDNQRKEGVSEEDIRAGIESVADRLKLTKNDIDSLMAGEVKPEVPTGKVEPVTEPKKETVSLKNASSRQTRIGLNLPEVKLPKIGTDVEALNEGKRLVDEGEIDPDNVIIKVLYGKGTVGMNPDESKAMLYHMTQLKAAETDVRRQMADAEMPEDKAVLNGKLQQISDAMDAATEANMLAGKAWSETGHVRQINVDESFNVSRERTIIKDAYGGTIPADVQTRIDKIIAERDAAINERNKIEKALRSRMAKESFEAMMKRANKLKNPAKEVLVNEEKELLTKLKQAFKKDLNNLNAGIPIPKETMEVIGKLAVNYIKQGMVTLDAIVNKIHDQIKGDVPQLSKDDIKDIIGNYRDFEREKEISLLEKKAGRLEKKLAEPEKVLPPKKEPLVFIKNTEWVKANQRVANAEFKMKVEKRKALESQKNMYQKGLMWAGRAVRLSVLSGYKVLGKLASAAVIGGAAKRLPEQAIGQMWAHVFRGVAEKAPIEGFSNAKAEAKFYKEFFNPKKFVENSWSILSTGESNLSKKMGSGQYEHVPFLYLPTDLHQIIKDPLKRAAFESSFLNNLIWAEKNGLDINDDLVIQSIETAAYKRANYEIFQEQTKLSKWVSQKKNQLERGGSKGATGKFLVDFLIPVSTVPTNIAKRIFSYSPAGLIKGSAELTSAYRKGIENLTNEQADKVMRHLKQGSLGTALWLVGWFGASYFGGLYSKYNPNKKRLEGELASDEMEVGGEMIPKPVQHALPLEVIQTAATMRHIYDNYTNKQDAGDVEALYRAGMGSIGAVVEQIPILETGANVYGAFKEPYYQAKLEEDVKRRFEPQILRETGIIETPKKEEKGGHAGVKLKLKKRGHGGGHHKIKQ